MGEFANDIGFYTYALAAGGYFALFVFLLSSPVRDGAGGWLMVAVAASLVWALLHVFSFMGAPPAQLLLSLAETVRGAVWIIFLVYLLSRVWEMQGNMALGQQTFLFFGLLLGAILGIEFTHIASWFGFFEAGFVARIGLYGKLIIAVSVILLVENLYRNTVDENRWGIRFFCLGLATLYVYDFLLYADTILFTSIGPKLYETRGVINFLVVPLLGIATLRNPTWSLNIQISRKVVFHSVSLIGSGAYLIGMSGAGYFLHNYGGKWGNVLQATFLFIAFLGFVVLITSGKVRSTLKVLLNKHFFRYHYDYREEWLGFLETISETSHHYELQERVVQAVADIMDSPGGALWYLDQPDHYSPVARWNFPLQIDDDMPLNDTLARFMEKKEWVVNLDEVEDGVIAGTDCSLPSWLMGEKTLWLVVPLLHHSKLVGFILLLRPRASRDFNWESMDILKIVGQQVASYLAEQSAEQALAIASEFEAFNRKFAFVVHDIKNLTSQLSLMVRNAEKHAANPDFQKDMILTVQDSVKKMNSLLSRISIVREPSRQRERETIELTEFLDNQVKKAVARGIALSFQSDLVELVVEAPADNLDTIIMHLVQNAVDAMDGGDKDVKIKLESEGEYAIIKIIDQGHGMTSQFIRNELFRPFRSTKEGGYGIGAYESREMIKGLGGRMDVKSAPGRGTTMTVYLRIAAQAEQ